MPDEYLRKASIAHDVKNLITRVCLAVETLEKSSEEPVQKQTQRISSALDQIATLCIREFGTPVAGRSLQTLNASDVKQLLREALQASRKGQEQSCSRISYSMSVDPDVHLTVDRILLFRIIFNLTANALNAMAKSEGGGLFFHVKRDADWTTFDVVDNGPGLPERILAFLYPRAGRQPLQRGRMGTGLMSAVSLAKELGGELSLVRSDADGSAFQLRVPTDSLTNLPVEEIHTANPSRETHSQFERMAS